ncbi:MAG: tRNA lysidine(34) synthetase TilS [Planctomycetes bacterium]|nr:tRNA lysidine(34) synthetase TilS [Planctomycetota bacterium]
MMRRFEEQLAEAWPVSNWKRVPILVAVSGGADSVALLRGLRTLAGPAGSALVVGHFNHRLRPDSDDDVDFVRDLSETLGVPCDIGVANEELAVTAAGSLEQAARDARYEFLKAASRKVGARYIVTAHTADDQAETILHRIVRGTGIRGLAGIPACRELVPGVTLVRPLLAVRRSEIVEYLHELGQVFRTDSTNSDIRFTRNRIRETLLPSLQHDFNPHADQSLRRLGALAEEMSNYVESVASEQLVRCVQFSADGALIDLNQLSDAPSLIFRTVLRQVWRTQGWPEREMTFERWHELEQLAQQSTVPTTSIVLTLPGNIRVERDGARLGIQKKGQP